MEDLFYVGGVLVEVGFGLTGSLEARTDSSVMGYTDLGGEISVRLYDDDLVETREDGRIYASPEAWAKLLREMRDMLARCMILGRMEVATDSFVLDTDEEDHRSIEEAEKLLGEEFLDITPEVALAALQARAENEEKIMARLKKIMTFMGEEGLRRGLNKEERGKITLREAFSPDEDEEEEGED